MDCKLHLKIVLFETRETAGEQMSDKHQQVNNTSVCSYRTAYFRLPRFRDAAERSSRKVTQNNSKRALFVYKGFCASFTVQKISRKHRFTIYRLHSSCQFKHHESAGKLLWKNSIWDFWHRTTVPRQPTCEAWKINHRRWKLARRVKRQSHPITSSHWIAGSCMSKPARANQNRQTRTGSPND